MVCLGARVDLGNSARRLGVGSYNDNYFYRSSVRVRRPWGLETLKTVLGRDRHPEGPPRDGVDIGSYHYRYCGLSSH